MIDYTEAAGITECPLVRTANPKMKTSSKEGTAQMEQPTIL